MSDRANVGEKVMLGNVVGEGVGEGVGMGVGPTHTILIFSGDILMGGC